MNKKIITNCVNCGAVMEYSKQYYGSMYKCPYCGTEHHIDLLGRIEEYKVKFMWMGRIIEAYLTSFTYEPEVLTQYVNCDGYHSYVRTGRGNCSFEFVGNIVSEN